MNVLLREAPKAKLKVKPNRSNYLPQLGTKGSDIIRQDTGEKVILKGVTSDAFRYGGKYRNVDEFIKRLQIAHDWGANAVTLYLDEPANLIKRLPELDKTIDWAKKNGMYVTLQPVVNGDGPQNLKPDDKRLDDIVTILSERYKDNKNIMYGFGAEPHDIDWKQWKQRQIDLGNIVRKNDPNAPLVVQPSGWGGDVKTMTEDPYPLPNTIITAHGYASENSKDMDVNKPDYEDYLGKLPMVVGEFGKYWGNDFGDQVDLSYIQEQVNKINSTGTSYTMHQIDPQEGAYYGLSVLDKNMKPTPKGDLISKDFSLSPPTYPQPKNIIQNVQNLSQEAPTGYKPLSVQAFQLLKDKLKTTFSL